MGRNCARATARPLDRFSVIMMTENLRSPIISMNRTATASYCITFEVKVNPSDLPEIDRRMECARQIYNTCLGQCQKRWRQIRSIPEWSSALSELQTLNHKTELSSDEKSRQSNDTALLIPAACLRFRSFSASPVKAWRSLFTTYSGQ